MQDETAIAQELLLAVGGAENISNISRSDSDVRFVLKDFSLIQDRRVLEQESVLSTRVDEDSYRVFLVCDVERTYCALCGLGGIAAHPRFDELLDSSEFTAQFSFSLQEERIHPMATDTGIDYAVLAQEIIERVGGVQNISYVTHCATRLRFNLRDKDKADKDVISNIYGVAGVMYQQGQLQLIIGPEVAQLYDEVVTLAPAAANNDAEAAESASQERQPLTLKRVGTNILNAISGCILPLIPIIVAASMFKMLYSLLGPTMLNVISADSDLYTLLTFVGDAGFYFLPVFIGYTAAKYFGATPILGMFLAAIMIHPTLIEIVNAGEAFTVYGIPMTLVDYSSASLPIVLIIWVMSIVEKFITKHTPASFKMLIPPTLTIAIMLPVALCVLGPLGSMVSTVFTNAMVSLASVGTVGTVIVGAISGGVWNVLVLCGMHLTYYMAGLTIYLANGYEGVIFPGTVTASVAIAGMTLGALLKIRDKEERALATQYFIAQVIGAVTEPAIFGIGIRYMRPFVFACVGGAAGGAYCALTGAAVYTTALANFTVFTSFLGSTTANFVNGVIGCAIALVVSCVLTYLFGIPAEKPQAKESLAN